MASAVDNWYPVLFFSLRTCGVKVSLHIQFFPPIFNILESDAISITIIDRPNELCFPKCTCNGKRKSEVDTSFIIRFLSNEKKQHKK